MPEGKASAGDIPVLRINTVVLKDQLASQLARQEHGPGFVHLPSWLPDTYWRELVAEKRTVKGWEKTSKRNEAIDLNVYGLALIRALGMDKVQDWSAPPNWVRGARLDEAPILVNPPRIARQKVQPRVYSRFRK